MKEKEVEQKTNDSIFKTIFDKYGLVYDKEDKKNTDVFITRQFKIITRSGVDKIQAAAGIIADYTVEFADPYFVMIKGTFTDSSGNTITTFGSATANRKEYIKVTQTRMKDGVMITQEEVEEVTLMKGNVTQPDPYLPEMAEKRCMARGVLKLVGLYQEGFFSEDESDTFSKEVRREKNA